VTAGWRDEESRETIEDSREESPDDDERSRSARIGREDSRTSYVVEGAAVSALSARAAGAR
jgi:hypothetical protein